MPTTKTKQAATSSAPSLKQVFEGIVVSTKMKDTVVVRIGRFVKHPKYDKYLKTSKRIKAHDAGNKKKEGERVSIEACAPYSKDKHFRVVG